MKKSIIWAAAGLMVLAACQQKEPGFAIRGMVNGSVDGDVVYLQSYDGTNMMKLDSAIVKNGVFEFKGTPDSLVESRFVTYMKGDQRMSTMVFVENGDIQVVLDPETSKVSGTPNNDVLQQFSEMFSAISKELNEAYTKSRMDSTLTEEQCDSVEQVLEQNRFLVFRHQTVVEQLFFSIVIFHPGDSPGNGSLYLIVSGWLEDIVKAAQLDGFLGIQKVRMGSEENANKVLPLLPCPAQQRKSVLPWHLNIAQQDVHVLLQ